MLTASRSNRRPTSSLSSSIDSSLKLIDELTPGRTFVGLREGPKTPAAGHGDGTRPASLTSRTRTRSPPATGNGY